MPDVLSSNPAINDTFILHFSKPSEMLYKRYKSAHRETQLNAYLSAQQITNLKNSATCAGSSGSLNI